MSRVYGHTDPLIYKNIDFASDTKVVFLSGLGMDIRRQREGFFRRFALTHSVSYLALDYTRYIAQFSDKEDFCLDTTLPKTLELLQGSKEKLILCGLCYGGSIALKVSEQIPEKIAGMVMLSPLYETPEYPFLEKSTAFLIEREERLKQYRFDVQKLQKVIIFRQMIQALSKKGPRALRSAYQGPVHIFHGEKDNLVPLENSFHVKEGLKNPNVHIHVIQKAGHGVISDFEWKEPMQILSRYLERTS